jgi:membrane-associated phospholipid phosphatase
MRRHFVLKVVGTTVGIGLFFIAYFHLLHHPIYAVTTMPLTALDAAIPFEPSALFVYLTLWLYVGAGPGLQPDLGELLAYGLWIALLCVAGLLVFLLWPTQVPAHAIDVSRHAGFAMLQGVDATGNAFPSMHVAIAIFTMLRLQDVWRRIGAPLSLRALDVAWCAGIVASTLLTKQHVVLDVVGGIALGAAFAFASLHAIRTPVRWVREASSAGPT